MPSPGPRPRSAAAAGGRTLAASVSLPELTKAAHGPGQHAFEPAAMYGSPPRPSRELTKAPAFPSHWSQPESEQVSMSSFPRRQSRSQHSLQILNELRKTWKLLEPSQKAGALLSYLEEADSSYSFSPSKSQPQGTDRSTVLSETTPSSHVPPAWMNKLVDMVVGGVSAELGAIRNGIRDLQTDFIRSKLRMAEDREDERMEPKFLVQGGSWEYPPAAAMQESGEKLTGMVDKQDMMAELQSVKSMIVSVKRDGANLAQEIQQVASLQKDMAEALQASSDKQSTLADHITTADQITTDARTNMDVMLRRFELQHAGIAEEFRRQHADTKNEVLHEVASLRAAVAQVMEAALLSQQEIWSETRGGKPMKKDVPMETQFQQGLSTMSTSDPDFSAGIFSTWTTPSLITPPPELRHGFIAHAKRCVEMVPRDITETSKAIPSHGDAFKWFKEDDTGIQLDFPAGAVAAQETFHIKRLEMPVEPPTHSLTLIDSAAEARVREVGSCIFAVEMEHVPLDAVLVQVGIRDPIVLGKLGSAQDETWAIAFCNFRRLASSSTFPPRQQEWEVLPTTLKSNGLLCTEVDQLGLFRVVGPCPWVEVSFDLAPDSTQRHVRFALHNRWAQGRQQSRVVVPRGTRHRVSMRVSTSADPIWSEDIFWDPEGVPCKATIPASVVPDKAVLEFFLGAPCATTKICEQHVSWSTAVEVDIEGRSFNFKPDGAGLLLDFPAGAVKSHSTFHITRHEMMVEPPLEATKLGEVGSCMFQVETDVDLADSVVVCVQDPAVIRQICGERDETWAIACCHSQGSTFPNKPEMWEVLPTTLTEDGWLRASVDHFSWFWAAGPFPWVSISCNLDGDDVMVVELALHSSWSLGRSRSGVVIPHGSRHMLTMKISRSDGSYEEGAWTSDIGWDPRAQSRAIIKAPLPPHNGLLEFYLGSPGPSTKLCEHHTKLTSNPHFRIDPSEWCINCLQLQELLKPVNDHFGYDGDIKVRDVVEKVIKPKTMEADVGYALMKNPNGMKGKHFISHSWDENFGYFCDEIQKAGFDPEDGMWICFAANPQTWRPKKLDELFAKNPAQSPFAIALTRSVDVICLHNPNLNMLTRLWCVYEMYLSWKHKKPIRVLGKPPPGTEQALQSGDLKVGSRATASKKSDEKKLREAMAGATQAVDKLVYCLLWQCVQGEDLVRELD